MQNFQERTDYNVSNPTAAKAVLVNTFLRGVYWWMTAGLALTGLVAWLVESPRQHRARRGRPRHAGLSLSSRSLVERQRLQIRPRSRLDRLGGLPGYPASP